MSLDVPKKKVNKLRKASRLRKVIQLKGEGLLIEEIALKLGVSEKTVDRDLKSQGAQQFTDELIRQQIIDIKRAKLPTRLSYRSDLLDKLLPKKMEQKIEGGETIRYEILDNSKDPEVSPASTAT